MTDNLTLARSLILLGAVAGCLFCLVATIEMFRRPGFDLARHAISMLSLGKDGWIMKSTFLASGALTFACAVGLFLTLERTWPNMAIAVLIGIYGMGLVIAGVFDAPASFGFPPGTPIDQQPVMTRSATLHSVGFMVAFNSLIIAAFVSAYVSFAGGQTLLSIFSLISGLAMPVLVGLGLSMTLAPGIAFYFAALVGWLWLGVAVIALPV